QCIDSEDLSFDLSCIVQVRPFDHREGSSPPKDIIRGSRLGIPEVLRPLEEMKVRPPCPGGPIDEYEVLTPCLQLKEVRSLGVLSLQEFFSRTRRHMFLHNLIMHVVSPRGLVESVQVIYGTHAAFSPPTSSTVPFCRFKRASNSWIRFF